MWSLKGIVFICCLVSTITALPATTQKENDLTKPPETTKLPEQTKPETYVLEAIELPSEKPADNLKPIDLVVDPKPTNEVKPTEQTKPESFGSSSPIFQSIPSNNSTPPRPQFLYDQRQDGKYNIRADLENFVILVIPSSGNSLLDLLKRSNQRPHHGKRNHHGKHHYKKYVPGTSAVAGKPVEVPTKKNRLDYLNQSEVAPATNGQVVGEFIEGRTPYHVDISSDEILPPSAFGSIGEERSLNSETASIPDVPLQINSNIDNLAGPSSIDSNATPILMSTLKGKHLTQPTILKVISNPRLRKSLTIDGYGNPQLNDFNSVLLTSKNSHNDLTQDDESASNRNYNNYFSRKHSVQIVNSDYDKDVNIPNGSAKLLLNDNLNSKTIDLTDSNNSVNSLNVGNIDRLALAGHITTKTDAELANSQWELSLLGAEEQCGPDRRRDSYGVCQFVPADYATT